MQSVLAFVGALAVLATTAAAGEIRGKPSVIDGHTIAIAGERIRLFGIEAPAPDRSCTRGGVEWACGREAEFALAFELAEHWVTCHEQARDPDGWIVALCLMGPYDVAARMVRLGWARALRRESLAYVDEEADARAARVGIWQGDPPPEWGRGATP